MSYETRDEVITSRAKLAKQLAEGMEQARGTTPLDSAHAEATVYALDWVMGNEEAPPDIFCESRQIGKAGLRESQVAGSNPASRVSS